MNRIGLALGCGGLAMAMAGGTVAHETFEYEAFGGFEDAPGSYQTFGFPGTLEWHDVFEDFGPSDPRDPNGARAGMSWGDPVGDLPPFAGKSGIGLRGVAGPVVADDTPVEFGTLVHFNHPVALTELTDFPGNDTTVSWNLILYHGPDVVFSGNFEFGLYQWETINEEPCPRATPGDHVVNGHTFKADGNNVTECDDAFTFQALDATPIAFSHDGEDYLVKILGWYNVDTEYDGDLDTWSYSCTDIPASDAAAPTFWSLEDGRNAACVRFAIETVTEAEMFVDIKPTSCPNPINSRMNPGRSRAVLPAAILGTESFDVTEVDPETVELCLDGNCISPVRWSYGHAAAPYEGEPCVRRRSCTTDNDEIPDLALKFNYNEMLDTLGLRDRPKGETHCLTIRAMTRDGTSWEGTDVIWISR